MQRLCESLYKDENRNPIILTEGQAVIFAAVFMRLFMRNHLMTYTQYGKTFTVALGTLTRVCTYPEKYAIVSGRAAQAQLTMNYIIQHAFDNEYTRSKLIITKEERDEAIKRSKAKNKMTFRHADGSMAEVFVLSADSRNQQEAGDAVMGFGSPNLILDEAALIDDVIEAKIFRMLGAQKDNWYLKIGNPFNNNHFRKDLEDPKYFHMNLDYIQGIAEGRLTREFVEEARGKPLFSILYENKFPKKELQDDKGYVCLLNKDDMKLAQSGFIGRLKLGIDPAGEGTDPAKWIIRDNFKMEVVATEDISTPASGVERTMTILKEYKSRGFIIKQEDIYVDSFGVGSDWVQGLALQGLKVNGINVGDPCPKDSEEREKFINMRAYASWELREWIISGGQIVENVGFDEFLKVKYKVGTARRIQIMAKKDMKAMAGIESPNTFDAAMLTFLDGADIPALINSRGASVKVRFVNGVPVVEGFDEDDFDMLG